MATKIAIIGAGSIGFTRTLMRDILGVPELTDTVFAFTDINPRNLRMMEQLANRDITANKLPAKIVATTDRRRAVAGADFVISTVRIGGLEGFKTDIEIPLKYGVDQCVGDTLCAGGIMYGQRNIAAILDFCKDIREVAKPGALFLNYANPNAMNTWAANTYGKVNCVGLCHGVQGGHHQIAEVIKLLVNKGKQRGDKGFVDVKASEVDITCAGINHQTWYTKILYKGKDWTGRMLEGFEMHPGYRVSEKVRIDILRRFGYFSTESNGHLSEYVPWYRKRPSEIKKWIDLSSWICGETGGYLRICTEGRNWFYTDFPKWMKQNSPPIGPGCRSIEHGSHIIEAMVTGRIYRGHFNMINRNTITNLPPDCVVEAPGFVNRLGIQMTQVGELPPGPSAVCNASINVQRLAVMAAVHGDVTLLKQAMMMDPLVGAVCTTPEISQMTDEMLIAQAKWLPQYRKALPEVKNRFRREPKLGIHGTKGAARLPVQKVKKSDPKSIDISKPMGSKFLPVAGPIRQLKYPGADVEISTPVPYYGGSNLCDIRTFHNGADGLVYLKDKVNIPKAGAGTLLYGSDGPVKVWINGKAAGCHPEATNPCTRDEYKAKTKWLKGSNEVLFAIYTNHGNAWGIAARCVHA